VDGRFFEHPQRDEFSLIDRSTRACVAARSGIKPHEPGKGLPDFVTFMEHRAAYVTPALALAWAQQPSNVQPAHWAQRLSFVRTFAQYRSATDPRTRIPAPGLVPFQPKRARPYLYSAAEIRGLLRAALTMP
jgi:integrase/recombinase XerD